MERLVPANRSRQLLLPPNLQEWVPEDDLVHFVIEALEKAGVDVYVPVRPEGTQLRRKHDYRPQPAEPPPVPGSTPHALPWIRRMREKLDSEAGRKLYAQRKQTVEPMFGIVKQAMGFRQFLLRGVGKVGGEWKLVCLAYNFRRLHKMALS
jgi:hypothetical protein